MLSSTPYPRTLMATDRPTLPPRHALGDAGGTPLYLRLANLIRDAISNGRWKPSEQLPTIPEFCEHYQVSRITVRQALQILSKEGLITSASGRGTFATDLVGKGVTESALRNAISDALQTAEHETMEVLCRVPGVHLPQELHTGHQQYPTYVRVRKVHAHRGQPFQISDTYVATSVYRRFPKHADNSAKTARLLRDFGGVRIRTTRQEMTLAHADAELAALLNCDVAGVLVRMHRWRLDETQRVVYAASNFYRGDRFVLEIETSHATEQPFSTGLVPSSLDSGR